MTENKVKIHDGKMEMPPVSGALAESINPILTLTLKKAETSSLLEPATEERLMRLGNRRKVKRTKSSGIF